MAQAIGMGIIRRISNIGDAAWNSKYVREIDEFPHGWGVYTMAGYAVPWDEWDRMWDEYPKWYHAAYSLLANAIVPTDELAGMTPEEIEDKYDRTAGDDFDHLYYTEVD